MKPIPYIIEIAQLFILLIGAPLFVGWIRRLKCWLQGRKSASLFQPYLDILKLFKKDVFLAKNASWIFRLTPYLVFGITLMIGAIIPILVIDLPFSSTADVIAIVALFAMIRFFTALAGMDIGTAFGGMGSSREMMIASLAEPAMLIVVFTVSLTSKSTSLSHIVQVITSSGLLATIRPSFIFAFWAFIMIAVAETGRIPVDNPATHLELTMIHEAMILEYSGRHLALMEWASMMKLFLFIVLGNAAFLPWGIADNISIVTVTLALFFLIIKFIIIGVVLVVFETSLAKMRLFRVTEFLGAAFLIAMLGMLSYFILE
ncbi:MAG: NADH-quinone oxidoreductase subunit H [Candidatus Margulisbacteria bacterium]|nr:NADH-quinone oxidoreductase subunit H [Candidatus Margulisiibacteriota bacterium]